MVGNGKYTASQEGGKNLTILLLEISIGHQIQASSYSIAWLKKNCACKFFFDEINTVTSMLMAVVYDGIPIDPCKDARGWAVESSCPVPGSSTGPIHQLPLLGFTIREAAWTNKG